MLSKLRVMYTIKNFSAILRQTWRFRKVLFRTTICSLLYLRPRYIKSRRGESNFMSAIKSIIDADMATVPIISTEERNMKIDFE